MAGRTKTAVFRVLPAQGDHRGDLANQFNLEAAVFICKRMEDYTLDQ